MGGDTVPLRSTSRADFEPITGHKAHEPTTLTVYQSCRELLAAMRLLKLSFALRPAAASHQVEERLPAQVGAVLGHQGRQVAAAFPERDPVVDGPPETPAGDVETPGLLVRQGEPHHG